MARTIASWWQSPGDHNLTALSHGLPWSDDIVDEIRRLIASHSTTPLDAQRLSMLVHWVDDNDVTVVWSSYGHQFQNASERGYADCLTCGAQYRVVHDAPESPSHGAYLANDGGEPAECTGNTSMIHTPAGVGDEHGIGCDGCADCDHDCPCVICTA